MITRRNLPEMPQRVSPELIERSAKLPEPDNYYAGQSDTTAVLPKNILLFHRDTLSPAHRDTNVHNRYVLFCCLKTPGTLFVNEQMLELPEGHATLIFPHQFHHYILPKEPTHWLFITFELPETQWLSPLQNRVFSISPETESILFQLLETYSSEKIVRHSHILTHTLGYLLANLIQTDKGNQDESLQHTAPKSRAVLIIQKINRFIYANLDQNLNIDTLAANVGVSASHLRLLVRSRIGIGLGHYINRIRINHAEQLLAETDLPIKHIAIDCGFNSSQSFARAFRRATGVAPHQFRRNGNSM
ncbi:helix-turn-helix transcriptional regulator [Tichowtungia aerotolerans]|uniref:Helix-turn-helix domain-containing protein n=1 Tax=Tichowtungia aerotolerans TaxID=2697043 RepID=A0A6P1M3V5_9BACT|nr:helix-turn-helix domain-containing protein [Tichowtungia aerotolerans]QHI69290.1 helix-turn-helix domain-containing protein [Tichowtungia aerotolerans]